MSHMRMQVWWSRATFRSRTPSRRRPILGNTYYFVAFAGISLNFCWWVIVKIRGGFERSMPYEYVLKKLDTRTSLRSSPSFDLKMIKDLLNCLYHFLESFSLISFLSTDICDCELGSQNCLLNFWQYHIPIENTSRLWTPICGNMTWLVWKSPCLVSFLHSRIYKNLIFSEFFRSMTRPYIPERNMHMLPSTRSSQI